MALNQKDLTDIKDIVEFVIEKSELRMEKMMDEKLTKVADRLEKKIDREIGDIAETNRAFLDKLDNHETRIGKLEENNKLKLA
ncbi:MAG: hypothetical protein AAB881_01160 [Patescibacteria group bacterium]